MVPSDWLVYDHLSVVELRWSVISWAVSVLLKSMGGGARHTHLPYLSVNDQKKQCC